MYKKCILIFYRVGKKDGAGEGMNRLCINYAPLNKRTIPDRYPLPNINEMLSSF